MMKQMASAIRPFIGAKDYELSRNFYKDLGFEEVVLSASMSLFKTSGIGFYLQDAYVKDWIDNTMVFVEVKDAEACYQELAALELSIKYPAARLVPVKHRDWGKECFVHDPSGVLWHFGEFAK